MQELYATVDLGSNSFHMLTAAVDHNEVKILDSISEKVMLAEGLNKSSGIAPAAMQRGLECIARFRQRLADIPTDNIRIIGTNTLRAAKNTAQYVSELEDKLDGIDINIVSGIEEARLIYLGVNHSWSSIAQLNRNLVIDIGGGSTEFMIGHNFKLKKAESLRFGCVAYRRFFKDEKISKKYFNLAVESAKLEINNVRKELRKKTWDNVIGSAGTFKAIERILIESDLSEEGITLSGLYTLKERLLQFKSFDAIEISGINSPREKTILPGVAIACAVFESLNIQKMQISRGGLREGILYDLIGRHQAEDIRQRSITALCRRYSVSESRIKNYRKICRNLVANIDPDSTVHIEPESMKYLEWAAQCSRIGLAINHSQYQRHSAYLIKHSELSGFTLKEREILSVVVVNHRRKIDLESLEVIDKNKHSQPQLAMLILVLRLIYIIGQNGKLNKSTHIILKYQKKHFTLQTNKAWLEKNPLLKHALKKESKYWRKTEYYFSTIKV